MGPDSTPQLKRTLTLPLLSLYGLGTILGAGIYVLIGEVASHAGMLAPLSFMIAAVLASITAVSFAELSARIPKSAGEAAYVDVAFGRKLATGVGLAVVVVGTVSAATMSIGFRGYLRIFIDLPDVAAVAALVLLLGFIAAWGVSESVATAALLTIIEIGGLIIVLVVASPSLATLPERAPELVPSLDGAAWQGILIGAFIAFYAFIGFEDMVNMAEEVKRPQLTIPRGIIIALIAATVLYLAVAVVAVLALPIAELAGAEAPLARIYESATGSRATLLSAISLFAVSNGALVQIIMGARVVYGLSKQGELPKVLGKVNAKTRTPLLATAIITIAVFVLAALFPLGHLAQATTFITLAIFATVNLALVQIKRRDPNPDGIRTYPFAVPVLGFLVSTGFIVLRATQLLL